MTGQAGWIETIDTELQKLLISDAWNSVIFTLFEADEDAVLSQENTFQSQEIKAQLLHMKQ